MARKGRYGLMQVMEEKIAHLERVVDDLSGVVAGQAEEIAVLTRQVTLLIQRDRERVADGGGGVILGDERPPHY
jgi:SlyX protein